MCPLRLILIFLYASLAGFVVLRDLKSQPQITELDQNNDDASETETLDLSKVNLSSFILPKFSFSSFIRDSLLMKGLCVARSIPCFISFFFKHEFQKFFISLTYI